MPEPPSGWVAFLFTDLEGSTRLWERRAEVMPAVYARHDAILRAAVTQERGLVYKVVGDAFQAAFPSSEAALRAAIAAQRALLAEPWPVSPPPRVRMALHACTVTPAPDGDYRTPGLNRLGRLLSAADGGQILLTETLARDLVQCVPAEVELRDLGEQQFRDLSPQRVHQVHAPGLSPEPARLKGLVAHRHNLPHQATTFVGREAEIQRLQQMLADPDVRVVTLLGPGGIGKTRLAITAAAAMADHLRDGAWFVPLASLVDPDLVPAEIARVLGVREAVDQTTIDALVAHLAGRETLLVLDNLEQVPGAGVAIADLVAACQGLTVLVTSRALLGIADERPFPVPPLAVPAHPARPQDVARLAALPAVRLFLDRARVARPGFDVDDGEIAAIAAICQRLDGLPLAIELAAARTRLLTPAQLLARLDARLPLLTGGPRDAPARQQTLRATIAWSYDLLAPPARSLLARLAIFRGGAALEAIEAVCADQEIPADAILDLVEALAGQSLLAALEEAIEPRLNMLETIREFALERLADLGEAEIIADRHAAHFLDLAERAQEPLSGPEQADWLDLLAREHDNLRAALDHFARRGAVVEAVQLAGALWQFWWIRGHLAEGRERLRQALANPDRERVPPATLARALDGAGALAEAQGDAAQAAILHEEALTLWRRAGDRLGEARALENLGLISLHDRADAPGARHFFQRALALYREKRDQHGVASVLRNLGDAALTQERFAEAATAYHDALTIARRLDDTHDVAAGLTSLGALAFFQGDAARAIGFYEESLVLWRQLGDLPGTALALGNLGEALAHAGDTARAKSRYEESLALARELGDQQGVAFAQTHLARIARQDGDPPLAAALFVESIALCHEIGDEPRLAEAVEGLAGLLIDAGKPEAAARLFGAAAAVRARCASPLRAVHLPAYERDLHAVQAALGAGRCAALQAEGATLDPAQLLTALPSPWPLPTQAGDATPLPAGRG